MECIFCGYLDTPEEFVADETGQLWCPSCCQRVATDESLRDESSTEPTVDHYIRHACESCGCDTKRRTRCRYCRKMICRVCFRHTHGLDRCKTTAVVEG